MSCSRFCGLFGVAILVAVLSLSAAQAEVYVIDNSDTSGITYEGTWGRYNGLTGAINDNYEYSHLGPAASPTVTYTPSSLSQFAAGTYDVYVNWALFKHPSVANTTSAVYTVNSSAGSQSFEVDELQYASQGTNGAVGTLLNFSNSGYRYLGRYTFDASSNVVLSTTSTTVNTDLIADSVMFRTPDAGRYIDPLSSDVTASRLATLTNDTLSNYPSGTIPWWENGDPLNVSYNPQVSVSGLYDVKVSWAAWNSISNGAVSATCFIDTNGNGTLDSGEYSRLIDTRNLADGTPATDWLWSDYLDLGSFQMTPSTQIVWSWDGQAQDDGTRTRLHLGTMVVTPIPEPGTAAILGMALAGLVAYAWRKRR